jgi:hypothetical protein
LHYLEDDAAVGVIELKISGRKVLLLIDISCERFPKSKMM